MKHKYLSPLNIPPGKRGNAEIVRKKQPPGTPIKALPALKLA